ncbi:MAG: hypothetical protein HY549_09060 [Elusimicrobia bacterium]|nr:hypothetical protein [Elusimicrobiota bacterium]
MSSSVVIALDQGSSSSRALAVDSRGRIISKSQIPVRIHYPRPGWAEHDALELALSQERALGAVLSRLPRGCEVLGLGLACQRSTVILWDKDSGRPISRAPSWQDGRAAQLVASLQSRQAEAHKTTGLYLTPYYSAPKMRWFLEHSAAARRLARSKRLMIGPVGTFLAWRMSRGEVFAVDPTLAQRMMLLNLESLDWDRSMLEMFGLDPAWLPALLPSVAEWGFCRAGSRRLKLLACLGDQQAAAIGLGGARLGSSVANYGTGAFFLHNTGSRLHRIPGLLSSVGWTEARGQPCFFQEGTVHAAAASFDWLRSQIGILDGSSHIDRLCRRSRQRVLALPAIGGLGAPRWDYVTQTAFFGLNSKTTPADLVRGVAEGIAFLIADIVAAMRSGGLDLGEVRVSGGLSRIGYLMQFQADMLGLTLSRCSLPEATAMGAAFLAARAAGADWADVLQKPKVDSLFKPAMSRQAREGLLQAWSRFVAAQAKLSREVKLS